MNDTPRTEQADATGPDAPLSGCVDILPAVAVHRDGTREEISASVIREVPFTIYLNDFEVITLLCAGMALESLAVGFLRSEGLLLDRDALESVEIDAEKGVARIRSREGAGLAQRLMGKRTITSGCGKGSTFHNALDALQSRRIERPLALTDRHARRLMESLHEHSDLYRQTHGVHNCALADGEGIVLFRADIGRHNAVDMLIGECFLGRLTTHDKILLTTGRITSEILIKAAKVGIPVIVSRSSPTGMAIRLARELNLTVIGRVRSGSMVLYSGAENVLPD